jgi:hypothetical protein
MTHPLALPRTVIVLCAILLSPACTSGTAVEQEYTRTFPISTRADVHIRVSNAQVRVTTTDDPSVVFHVHYEIAGSDSKPLFSTRQSGDVVELRENDTNRDWWGWTSLDVERTTVDVRMPKTADLQLVTSNGAVEVSSLNGDIRLHTSNGSITASELKGKLQVGSSNGAINVTGVDGDCVASTSNGSIQASGRFDSLDMHSSNGRITAHATAGSTVGSRWDIGTSNSSIDLALPPMIKANLDVTTSNGGIQLEMPVTVQGYQDQSHLHGALNGGGPEISVHTSNGHIHLSST